MNSRTEKGMQMCICGRYEKDRRSFFGKFDINSGWVILAVLAIVLLILKAFDVFLIIVLPLVIFAWLAFFVVWLTKKHSIKCAARWATVVVIGSIGGFWFLGF